MPLSEFEAIVENLKRGRTIFFALELRGIYLKNRIDFFSQKNF